MVADSRLLKNFYLNRGYLNVNVNSSFAKLIEKNEFELIYTVNAGNKVFFNNLSLDLPNDYDENFVELNKVFSTLRMNLTQLIH